MKCFTWSCANLLLAFGLSFLSADQAAAQNISWDGGGIGDNWGNPFNWNTNVVPGITNDVFIGDLIFAHNDQTFLSGDFAIQSLTMTSGTGVGTNGHQLEIGSGGLSLGNNTEFTVAPNSNAALAALQTTGITVENNGTLNMAGGIATVGGDVTVESGGDFSGNGTLNFTNGLAIPLTVFTNNGTLNTARPLGGPIGERYTLSLTANDNDARIDLDGATGNGQVDIATQTTLDLGITPRTFAGTMTMQNGSIFDNSNAMKLGSGGRLAINGGLGPIGGQNATLNGAGIDALSGSDIDVNSGTLVVNAANFNVRAGATLDMADGAGLTFNKTAVIDGDIETMNAFGLTVNDDLTINDADFDWDGSGTSSSFTTVNSEGTLTINSNSIGPANSYGDSGSKINLNDGVLTANIASAWTMAGELNLTSVIGASEITGSDINVSGDINVFGGNSTTRAPMTFESGSSVNVDGGANFITAADLEFLGGSSHTGAGQVSVGRDITVTGNTTIDMPDGDFELDNRNGPQTADINRDFTLNVASLDGHVGLLDTGIYTMNIDNADSTFTVNLTDPTAEWILGGSGVINVTGLGTLQTSLAGSDVNVLGIINVNDNTRFTARLDIEESGLLDLTTNELHMNGGSQSDPNRLLGGSIVGGGGLLRAFDTGLYGHGIVSPKINFTGGSDLFAEDGTLTIQSEIETADLVGAEAGGVLNLVDQLDTLNITALEMRGGSVVGSTIQNNGTTRGHGAIQAVGIVNNGEIVATGGGALVIDTINPPDLDGTTGSPRIQASSADLIIVDALAADFEANAVVSAGFAIDFEQGWTQGTSGRLNLNGTPSSDATLRGGLTRLNGEVNVSTRGRIEANTTFGATSNTTLTAANSRLNIANFVTLQAGATFTGNGTINVLEDGIVHLTDGLDIDVTLRNEGVVSFFGQSHTIVEVENFVQTTTGVSTFNIDGAAAGDYNQIIANQDVTLDGELEVRLQGSFAPAIDDAFVLLQATTGFVTGEFDSLDLPTLGGGLDWDVDYSDPLTVWLRVISASILAGDYDNSGTVSAGDLNLVLNLWGQDGSLAPPEWVNDRPTGTVSAGELNTVLSNWGNVANLASVPEPASATLLLLGMLAMLRRRN